jgi:hypothetical protein
MRHLLTILVLAAAAISAVPVSAASFCGALSQFLDSGLDDDEIEESFIINGYYLKNGKDGVRVYGTDALVLIRKHGSVRPEWGKGKRHRVGAVTLRICLDNARIETGTTRYGSKSQYTRDAWIRALRIWQNGKLIYQKQ